LLVNVTPVAPKARLGQANWVFLVVDKMSSRQNYLAPFQHDLTARSVAATRRFVAVRRSPTLFDVEIRKNSEKVQNFVSRNREVESLVAVGQRDQRLVVSEQKV